MNKIEILKKITDCGVVAVVRAKNPEQAKRISESCVKAGIAGIGVGWGYADVKLLRSSSAHRIVTTVAELEQALLDWAKRP